MNSKAKISTIFVPDNFYLSFADFLHIRDNINTSDRDNLKILLIPPIIRANTDALTKELSDKQLTSHCISPSLRYLPFRGKNLIAKLINYLLKPFVITINQYLIRQFLKKLNPKQVIFSSDIGRNVQKRVFIEEIQSLKIPIKIFYTCDLSLTDRQSKIYIISKKILKKWPKHTLARLLRALFDPLFIKRETIGTYAYEAMVFVIFAHVQNELLCRGISPQRLQHVQSPLVFNHEKILETTANKIQVVYFTECLQLLYDEALIKNHFTQLRDIFKEISNVSTKIVLILKIHPKEPPAFIQFLLTLFGDTQIELITNSISAEELILSSKITIAHFSRVLLTAIANKKPILSIDPPSSILKKISPPIIFEAEVRICNINNLKNAILSLVNDDHGNSAQFQAVLRMNAQYFPATLPSFCNYL